MTDKKPTTPIFAVGDQVKIFHHDGSYDAMVTEVKRVWITIRPEGWSFNERFRMDTRTPYASGKGYGSLPRLYTLAEWAERERERADRNFLSEQGIRFDPFAETSWTVSALADALRLAQSVGDPHELLALIKAHGAAHRAEALGATFRHGTNEILADIKKRLGIEKQA